MSRIAAAGSLLVLLAGAFAACNSTEGEGSESHFLTCRMDSECGEDLACVSGHCRRPASPLVSPKPDPSRRPLKTRRDASADRDGGPVPSEASPGDTPIDAGRNDAAVNGHGRPNDAARPPEDGALSSDAKPSDARPSDGASTPIADARRDGSARPEGGSRTDARRVTLDAGTAPPPCDVTEYPLAEAGANSYVVGITAGPDGSMWFTEQARIGRISMQGAVTHFPILDANSEPANIVVASDGNLWFTDPGTDGIGRITSQGVVTEFPAITDYAYSSPYGIAAGPDGNIWYSFQISATADIAPMMVVRMTVGGDAAGSISLFESQIFFGGPVAAGPDGNIWFTDVKGETFTDRISPSGADVGQGLLGGPLAVGSDGNMWILADAGFLIAKVDGTTGAVIQKYPIEPVALGIANAGGITLGPDGNMWFSLRHSNRIGRITPSGVIAECSLPPNRLPFGIARGPDGNIWFVEQGGGGYVAVLHVAEFPRSSGG